MKPFLLFVMHIATFALMSLTCRGADFPANDLTNCTPIHDISILSLPVDQILGRAFGPCCGAGNRCDLCVDTADPTGCARHDVALANCRRAWFELAEPCVREAHREFAKNSPSALLKCLFSWLGKEPRWKQPEWTIFGPIYTEVVQKG